MVHFCISEHIALLGSPLQQTLTTAQQQPCLISPASLIWVVKVQQLEAVYFTLKKKKRGGEGRRRKGGKVHSPHTMTNPKWGE